MKNEQGLRGARTLIIVQLMIVLIMARFVYVALGGDGVLSVMLGGLVYALPSACFAWVMFRQFKATHAKQYMKRIYRGEALKVVLTLLLFVFVFCFFKCIVPWVFLTSFFVVQSTMWLAPWIFIKKRV